MRLEFYPHETGVLSALDSSTARLVQLEVLGRQDKESRTLSTASGSPNIQKLCAAPVMQARLLRLSDNLAPVFLALADIRLVAAFRALLGLGKDLLCLGSKLLLE